MSEEYDFGNLLCRAQLTVAKGILRVIKELRSRQRKVGEGEEVHCCSV